VQNVNLGAGVTTTLVLIHPSPSISRLEVIRVPDSDAAGTTAPRDPTAR
jgi:hypothetical protein